ncbi:acetyl-CoA hydrolase/transferase family protein [Marinibaculum pumilum]|uniref:Acetyl-CoA hydrolase/transferase family protein n=1 Tax=Marinibaculum pumilum TaxID=1766165 RepID=A0ABV7KXB7_9PROT
MTAPITAERIPELLKPGMRVFVSGCLGESATIRRALQAAPEAARGVTFCGVLVPGLSDTDYAALHPEAEGESFFLPPWQRDSFDAGRLRLLPLNYSAIPDYLENGPRFDLAIVQVAADGTADHGFGACADFQPYALRNCDRVLAHLNPRLPATRGHDRLPAARIDWLLEAEEALPDFPDAAPNPVQQAIAQNCATLIRDGDVIQIGIGKVQSAILQALSGHRDLGFHSGLVTDAAWQLVESGAITGARRNVDRGLLVAGSAAGTAALYRGLSADFVEIRPVRRTHMVTEVARIENFVSLNGALEVDLFGQVNSELVDGRFFSGVGGFNDFVRGARLSPGGRSIVALPAALRGGGSRIVASLSGAGRPAAPLTGARADSDIVVTEFGVADLRHLDLDGRAAALIAIAPESARETLSRAWQAMRRAL